MYKSNSVFFFFLQLHYISWNKYTEICSALPLLVNIQDLLAFVSCHFKHAAVISLCTYFIYSFICTYGIDFLKWNF